LLIQKTATQWLSAGVQHWQGNFLLLRLMPERIERAIAKDLTFLAAHPIRGRKGNAA
jgi:hypothetical protein